jgi:hypothetical protein
MMDLSRLASCFASPLVLGVCLLSTATAQSSGGQVSVEALRNACASDAARLCSGVPSGGGRIIACLKQHQSELSDACRKAGGLPPRTNAADPNASANNPPDSTNAQPPSGRNALAEVAGDYHYTNGLGDYRTYSDPNMTPEKAGESGAWTPMTTVQ